MAKMIKSDAIRKAFGALGLNAPHPTVKKLAETYTDEYISLPNVSMIKYHLKKSQARQSAAAPAPSAASVTVPPREKDSKDLPLDILMEVLGNLKEAVRLVGRDNTVRLLDLMS